MQLLFKPPTITDDLTASPDTYALYFREWNKIFKTASMEMYVEQPICPPGYTGKNVNVEWKRLYRMARAMVRLERASKARPFFVDLFDKQTGLLIDALQNIQTDSRPTPPPDVNERYYQESLEERNHRYFESWIQIFESIVKV